MNRTHRIICIIFAMHCVAQGCFLFPTPPPEEKHRPITMVEIPQPQPFVASFVPILDWLILSQGVLIDIYPRGQILCIRPININGKDMADMSVYDPNGVTIYGKRTGQLSDYTESYGTYPRKVVANHETSGLCSILYDRHAPGKNMASYLEMTFGSFTTNQYTKYNPVTSRPDNSYGSDNFNVLFPSIAKANKTTQYGYSTWMVGAFTDSFKPSYGLSVLENTSPTYGEADCFVIRYGYNSSIPVRHQWGGPENDLAYDVLGDDIGNATIFLRAGSDFGITSATQSIVRMTTGYNVVKLDTNGLLLSTYPVRLEAQGEISRVETASAGGNAIFILAKDEAKKEYFLAKATPSGTAWIRYLGQQVSTRETSAYTVTPRMGLTSDSKGNAYITGSFFNTVDFGGMKLESPNFVQMFVASYSPNNTLRGALAMGTGVGAVIRLSPDEQSVYVTGIGTGPILGQNIPDPNIGLPTRDRVYSSPAFLVKLKLK